MVPHAPRPKHQAHGRVEPPRGPGQWVNLGAGYRHPPACCPLKCEVEEVSALPAALRASAPGVTAVSCAGTPCARAGVALARVLRPCPLSCPGERRGCRPRKQDPVRAPVSFCPRLGPERRRSSSSSSGRCWALPVAAFGSARCVNDLAVLVMLVRRRQVRFVRLLHVATARSLIRPWGGRT